jgi:virulence-associated protein VagC
MFVGRLMFMGLDGRKVLTFPVDTDFSTVRLSVVRTGSVCIISPSFLGYNARAGLLPTEVPLMRKSAQPASPDR